MTADDASALKPGAPQRIGIRAGPTLWRCPVCRSSLRRPDGEARLVCQEAHSFDIARQGYVNLLQKGRRPAGDNPEMVAARRAFLATGAYQPVSDRISAEGEQRLASVEGGGSVVLDVGCGDGYYTRRLAEALGRDSGEGPEGVTVAGVDVAKSAVAAAASQHRHGLYAVASAFDLPVPTGSVDLLVSVFGPVAAEEFGRVLRLGGKVIAVHPGPGHLGSLRALVYDRPQPHDIKDPLRGAPEVFTRTDRAQVSYPLSISSAAVALQLFAMTPYRWHAPRDIAERLDRSGGLETQVDVIISTYERAGSGEARH